MSSETAARKKRSNSESTPAPEGDHRKRRRNRTTQSCLNCHTSKRMCDRKRPACARCTQLGLTGLCVYEVDDPSQRTETQDESSRLLKRVAELEGVIRELKNKPHPRWTQTANSAEEFEKWHSRPLLPGIESESCSSNAPSPPASSSSSERGESGSRSSTSAPTFAKSANGTLFPPSIHLPTGINSRRKSPYQQNSPLSTPSPPLLTPTDEYPLSHIGISGQGSLPMSQDFDLASMFMTYPGLMGCSDNSFGPMNENRPDSFHTKHSGGHCGCLHEPTSYTVMLELSLRLRKASDVLSRSTNHQIGGLCHLHQRISDLDSFASTALSDISVTPSDLPDSLGSPDRAHHGAMHGGFHPSHIYPGRSPSASQGPMQNIRTWDLMSSGANSPASLDDSFMSWEPPRRP
ncbi:hypothetical protein B0H34DRAFT_654203 [Crassisporium funariophilum]|nr:hypothetical protein B0H34DRAFT_654203 [Crassisporium funariophilum]